MTGWTRGGFGEQVSLTPGSSFLDKLNSMALDLQKLQQTAPIKMRVSTGKNAFGLNVGDTNQTEDEMLAELLKTMQAQAASGGGGVLGTADSVIRSDKRPVRITPAANYNVPTFVPQIPLSQAGMGSPY